MAFLGLDDCRNQLKVFGIGDSPPSLDNIKQLGGPLPGVDLAGAALERSGRGVGLVPEHVSVPPGFHQVVLFLHPLDKFPD